MQSHAEELIMDVWRHLCDAEGVIVHRLHLNHPSFTEMYIKALDFFCRTIVNRTPTTPLASSSGLDVASAAVAAAETAVRAAEEVVGACATRHEQATRLAALVPAIEVTDTVTSTTVVDPFPMTPATTPEEESSVIPGHWSHAM